MRIAVVTISDRASRGQYEDLSGLAIEAWLRETVVTPFEIVRRIVPDGIEPVREVLVALCDKEHADLILTTGGTGPAPRDETPEAMRAVVTRELPGFGEQLRRASLEQTPTAILSRQMAGTRGRTLIVNLPGKPSSIRFSLNAVFAAVPYCLDLIGADWMDTDPARVKAFRPAPSSSG
ncbi:molybdopterin adenylyltransferase [Shinella sp. NM-101]|uniref:molybdopterin adenylyltransferase n=1 Tax=Shinella sp. NM-101 TaxID=2744455 RepID=UPI001F176DE1|nr:molybdopterin adenylyltransferase [Shinella sp. NM-101]